MPDDIQDAGGSGLAGFEPWVQSVPKGMVSDDMRGHKSQWDYLQSVYNSRDELSAKVKELDGALHVPRSGDPQDRVDAFRKALGVPENPDGYDLGEIPPEASQKFREVAHKLGLTPLQAAELAKFDAENDKEADRAFNEQLEASKNETIEALKKEYPKDYEARVQAANATLAKFFGEDGMREIAESGMGFKSWFVLGMMKMTEPFKEGRVLSQGADLSGDRGLVDKYPSMAHLQKRTW